MKHALARIVWQSLALAGLAAESARPNIVYILADDLGYGDVGAYDKKSSKIPTPHNYAGELYNLRNDLIQSRNL